MKPGIALLIMLIVVLLAPIIPACSRVAEAADGYAAVVPAVLQAGSQQTVSVALFKGQSPAAGRVAVALLKDGKEITQARVNINGKGTLQLNIPAVAEGEYQIRLQGDAFQDEANVKIENNFVIFLETDKPIYKPGQTIHIRTLTLDSELKPVSETVTIEVLDAKGTKIFRSLPKTDDFGMANTDLPVSTEPNLGTWKITATTPKAKSQLDVRVEEYVLPKYEIKVNLPKEWFLANEAIKGKVAAEYSFGKPVKGDLEIKAKRYVGQWQEYATFNVAIDGEAEFTIPAAGYVAGVPGAGGMGNVQLDFAVIEKSTDYMEKTSKLLTVAQSSLNLQIIPSSSVFKPGLLFTFMLISKAPDSKLVDTPVKVQVIYYDKDFKQTGNEDKTVDTKGGKALIEITPRADSVAMTINASATQGASVSKTIEAGYSPSGNFIHLEQISLGTPNLGEQIKFKVYSTKEAVNCYYEVVARGKVVFSNFTKGSEIAFPTDPLMAPSAKLLVYQILPNAEVAADFLPFNVNAQYPQTVKVDFSVPEAKPGDDVNINVQTEGEAKVGIAVVDKSVFILAENRLNLQQVFDELEKLYMKPQAELHEVSIYQGIVNRGAKEIFSDAGVVVLSNQQIPEGKEIKRQVAKVGPGGPVIQFADGKVAVPAPAPQPPVAIPAPTPGGALAEVQRVRQFFPETWLWDVLTTNSQGKGSLNKVKVPDSITTWMLRAVALSKSKGLGVADSQLKAFQPFFLSVDLPYSAIRGEEFPVRVAVYNYLNQTQTVVVQAQKEDWFELLDSTEKTIEIKANDIGSAEFKIRPVKLGTNGVNITARSKEAADAVIKTLIIEPEGISKELVDNLILSGGKSSELSTLMPLTIVAGSGRAYLTVTAGYLTQTIEGLEKLLQMPFGCGEQNMIVFAPDVFITRYLKQSGQLKPEIMAKAEKLMLTGYQRELTYRRTDGSFSAFGNQDKEGSLWLTAFVLRCFAQATDLIYIDDGVLEKAKSWITSKQKADGSFDVVGFIHHQEMMGGLKGKNALTAYVAIALMQAGEKTASAKAVAYLEGKLGEIDDAYSVALVTYALELGNSVKKADAYNKLMKLAQADENGLHWGSAGGIETPLPQPGGPGIMRVPPAPKSSDIEATGYAAMALVKHGDVLNAGKAARWLVSKRNAYGGFDSTQDTMVGLEALTTYASGMKADVDLTISVESGGKTKQLQVKPENYDILQVVEVPINDNIKITASGRGEVITQLVRRFNLPDAGKPMDETLKVKVDYDVTQVAVNDLVKVSAELTFNPPIPAEAGMIVLDISVPTGFAAVSESIAQVIQKENKIKRYEISGRKVIFYIENMLPGDRLAFSFNVKALYPVKAKGVTSQAYSYYKPEIQSETLGKDVIVLER